MQKTFDKLIAPLTAFFEEAGTKIDEKSGSRTFFFKEFVQILIFGISLQVSSLRKLMLELKSNPAAKILGLREVSNSTFRDGFSRFKEVNFSTLYQFVLNSIVWKEVPELNNLGLLKAVDGSLFPVLRSMDWAEYKQNFKALKLHLAFNLNTSCSSEFLIKNGNSSERSFLISILKKGETYICDRGYFSFEVLRKMSEAKAMFVLRLKSSHKFKVGKTLKITGEMPLCFSKTTDELVRFTNDNEQVVYRIVRFQVQNSHFILCTNRADLTTLQVIMLYAYRWQIELIFKFLKRSLKGLHLLAQTEECVKVHFYMLLLTALLQLSLKQLFLAKGTTNNIKKDKKQLSNLTNTKKGDSYLGANPEKWMNSLNNIFNISFKISSNWLLYLKNFIAQDADNQVIELFNSM